MKRSQRKRQIQIAEKEHRGEELGRRRAEGLREAHSAEQSGKEVSRRRRAQPTAGEKSTANSRRKEHTQQQGESKEQTEQCQLQAETYEENHVWKEGIGPMTRDTDTECHQRMAADQELKVAEKAREHQVELETEIEVEKHKADELRNQVQTVKKSL